MQNKVTKNLQMAKDLNREMEAMFAEDDEEGGNFRARPAKKQKKKAGRPQQVQF